MDTFRRKICGANGYLKINRGMIPIKIAFLLSNLGEEQKLQKLKSILMEFLKPHDLACMMPFGFFNLQAINIGLTVGDVGIVAIVVSVFSLACNPLIGNGSLSDLQIIKTNF